MARIATEKRGLPLALKLKILLGGLDRPQGYVELTSQDRSSFLHLFAIKSEAGRSFSWEGSAKSKSQGMAGFYQQFLNHGLRSSSCRRVLNLVYR